MSELVLARIQFASTTLFHFLFVPLSIGLVFMVALMETLYLVKKNELYLKMAKFWGHLFLINFAVGVVTGILQEFQFGMNWSDYSRFVGDVFGAPLAIEALLAFFMESIFIGLWIFGWDRLPKKIHVLCIWLVSFGTIMSSFWILTANSFMQEPVGFTIKNGRAEMNDFAALITNPQLWVEFPHVIFGALATGAFFIAGVSAFKLLKKKEVPFFKHSFKLAMIVGLCAGLGVALSGHAQAEHLMKSQPMKMAASEGLWEDSGDPAAWTAFAMIDTKNEKSSNEIKVPYALSYLAYQKFSGSVKGMKTLQAEYEKIYGKGDYIPPVKTTFWSFRIMVGAGVVMILATLGGLWLNRRKKLETSKWYLRLMIALISFPFIANSAGWIMTEIGRQPWTVMGLMTTAQSVSPNVTAGSLLFSIIAFGVMYLILGALLVFLFVREIKKGAEHGDHHDVPVSTDPFSQEVYHVSS
ncbi:cytochrome ubiquinol oxidase subunit I [Bacillus vallismortis]|uniref:Cytochrome ubiquinol oxidase subunit I n=1 Tax=Bacillus vallismortis TaxID=72361 RepID=A0AAP3CJ41_BACVA|nr:cytochrome ubiquinol oxidase subunit I [Bacillus vallismortis]MCY8308352.1 cytochrome ubiquinol oxidase subunit I [Bacillus vallismortis]MCY8317231.1 cytochrome ubiquinol oxidase subunit I [Bacillus vallismortis]MCY8598426.1 cytochrome ubiquinol oxidase subunit I [Bacillus vallismortis]MEC1650405.1 cytochrome ubiquinol oxidase subunit I [Bacillus vallismortis]MEC1791002.1 cytochrome ubiquinol oxidase subunit I [Bacillus vallismortis]